MRFVQEQSKLVEVVGCLVFHLLNSTDEEVGVVPSHNSKGSPQQGIQRRKG